MLLLIFTNHQVNKMTGIFSNMNLFIVNLASTDY
jgi:hypothetical protein